MKHLLKVRQIIFTLLIGVSSLALVHVAAAQDDCDKILCAPQLTVEPGVQVARVFGSTTVGQLPSGDVLELPREVEPVMIVSVEVPTEIPRISLALSLQWTPFAEDDDNPYTGYTADQLGVEAIDANAAIADMGVSFQLLSFNQTKGVYATNLNLLDQFSPAREPDDARFLTHKLQLEWEGRWGIFKWLSKENYLHDVVLYTTLEYVATGLPDEQDEIPRGERVYLEDASPWGYYTGLRFPLAPLK